MARVVLGVTGSVAAIRTPALFAALREHGHEVRVVATEPASISSTPPSSTRPARCERRRREPLYPRPRRVARRNATGAATRSCTSSSATGPTCSIVAPLDANTLAKFALGLCDNFLTCLFRAWDFSRPVILAPAMNTLMWQSPVTARHLGAAAARPRSDCRVLPDGWSLDDGPRTLRPPRSRPDPDPAPVQAPGLRRRRPGRHGRGRDDRRGGADVVEERNPSRNCSTDNEA